MQAQSKDTGTDSKQDRSIQPGRLEGGNSSRSEVATESHLSKRGTRIKQGSGGGELQGLTTGCGKEWGNNERVGGGNNSEGSPSREMHDSPKAQGKHFRGGVLIGMAATDLMPVQVSDRGLDESGNSSKGGRQPSGQEKAERLDMSTSHRFQR